MITIFFCNSAEHYYGDTGVSLSVSSSSIKIGNEVSVTVSIPSDYSATIDVVFPANMLSFQSASSSEIGKNQIANGRVTVSLSGILNLTSITIKFKSIASGEGTIDAEVIKAGNTMTEEAVNWSNVSRKIVVENQITDPGNGGGTTEPQKSDDNSLSSLKLSNATLSPSFKKSTTKYTATVAYDVTKVVVSAKTSNNKAVIESVTDDGTVNLKVGENTIKIVVRAENGVKATYTIVVTRKAQESTPVTPPEVDTPPTSEITPPEVNEMLQWNGEQLQPVETIPQESIPANFESTLLVVNGQQLQGLTFTKGDLKVLYLNNTNGAGSLYVYDEAQQTIYPFIKLISEKGHVIVLLPDEQNAPAPEGFENCTFSIEGKGLVSAYQLKEDIASEESEVNIRDFYLVYCMNDAGEKGWYMYDSIEGTYQRYIPIVPSVQTGSDDVVDTDLESKYTALEKELNTAKMTQYIILAIAAAVIFILLIVIIVLAVKGRKKKDDSFGDDKANQNEENENQEIRDVAVAQEILAIEEALVMEKTLDKEEEEDEFEIEFYEIEEQIEEPVEEPEIPVDNQEEIEVKDEPEFLDLENAILDAIQEAQKEVEPEQEPEIKIVRKPKATDLTSKLSSEKEADDDDLVFIDFD